MSFGSDFIMLLLKVTCVTQFVHLLSGNVDTDLTATFSEKHFPGVNELEENDATLNLLGCRPINIAVLDDAVLLLRRRMTSRQTLTCAPLS